MRKWFMSVFVVLALVVASNVQAGAQFYMMENPMVGKAAPDFELKDLSGQNTKFAEFSKGKDSILFFWATWCPHCRSQLKELKNREAQLANEGVEVLLLDLGEDLDTVNSFLAKNNIAFKVLIDADGTVSDQYKVVGIPTFVFVNKAGEVRSIEHTLGDDYLSILRGEVK